MNVLSQHMNAVVGIIGTLAGTIIGSLLTYCLTKKLERQKLRAYSRLVAYSLISLISELANIKKQLEHRREILDIGKGRLSHEDSMQVTATIDYPDLSVDVSSFGAFAFTTANKNIAEYYIKICKANFLYRKSLNSICKFINESKAYIFQQHPNSPLSENIETFITLFNRNYHVVINELEKTIVYIEEVLEDWQQNVLQNTFKTKAIKYDRHHLEKIT